MYNYIDFEFNFTFNKAMKEKVSGVPGAPVSARVAQILITVLYNDLMWNPDYDPYIITAAGTLSQPSNGYFWQHEL